MTYTFDFSFLAEYWPELLSGLMQTAQLSILSIIFGFLLGTVLAVGRTADSKAVRRICAIYVEAIRNTPLLVQMFMIYFGLASIGFKLSAEFCAVLAIVINVSSYTCEIMRAGIESIKKGQLEASDCLAMSWWQRLFLIVLPPATERVYPALVSQFILIMLATSLVSQISAEELTSTAVRIDSMTFRSFEIYTVIAVIYIALAFVFRIGFWALSQLVFPRLRRLGTPL
ncbi:amino acid ABC transporter permease [Paracoccus laeviglucosivorans]|uniref:Amino acid ABC transporter membrane protein 1, PAAT family n=1 Tax=Paracoccus laeviglucosivorans TaxID=1197861 RepID=K7ZQX8_9RHOB|nr:amino acid ABC transporter permease [Paracoccus laeviglucosivorans]BAM68204.1 putative ABC transporter, inner membrane subunit lgnA [Paracoccus laeviglucosivorans]SMO97253.1 amino acid ABC transporter membrane protein 1, PAAT family [Paracoccus laeviglucosivorans]